MLPTRLPAWLPLMGILVIAAGALGWLFLRFAGDPGGSARLVWAAPVPASADGPGWRVEFLVDDQRAQAWAEVRALPADAWRPPSAGNPGGVAVSARTGETWLRVTWENPAAQPVHGVLSLNDFFMDEVECWSGDGAGGWRYQRTGESVPAREKALGGRNAAVAVDVPAHGTQVACLRLHNAVTVAVWPRWWAEAARYHDAQDRRLVADGLYFGGLLALLGYNLVLWLRLRFADIGWYVLYLGSMLGFLLLTQGEPQVFGWATRSPGLEVALTVTLAATGIFLAGFARVFLEVPARLPRGDRVLRVLRAGLVALAAGALTIPWTDYYCWMQAVALGVVATHLWLVGLAVASWRAGVRQARFFLGAFACMFLGALVLAGLWLWSQQAHYAGLAAVMTGSALEMLLLSLAVADRFVRTQERLQEETEQRRAIQEAYADELEVEVRERTADLAAANEDKDRMLVALGHDLRGPLAALTQRAEQLRPSTGSGPEPANPATPSPLERFASEAAGAGRQMLLLIEDIVLWARLRTGARPVAAAFSAPAIVLPVVALHRAHAERRGVALTADIPETLRVQTDLVLAQTMVRNLVGNAVKFAPTRVEVIVRAPTPGRLRITVRDDGRGLPLAAQARLRGESAADAEGGMGLRLVREIGAALGVTIAVETPPNGGTAISLTFPEGAAHTP